MSDSEENVNSLDDERKEFSCWDKLDPERFKEIKDYSTYNYYLYVHEEILEWVVKYIDQNVLNKKLRGTVEEIYHHNLDGQMFLIKFHTFLYSNHVFNDENFQALLELKDRLQYSMPWKTKPTYFLPINSKFEKQKAEIMRRLKKENLHNNFETTSLVINWFGKPKIEMYQFSESLTKNRITEIDRIFQDINQNFAIYICDQFSWHTLVDHVDVDTLAMDICTEEWRRYDLMKDFLVEDILNLDVANKDYRDPDFNVYLDKYLNILMEKLVPELSFEHKGKFTFFNQHMKYNNSEYFVWRFHEKISDIIGCKMMGATPFNDIPINSSARLIDLNGDYPSPDQLVGTYLVNIASTVISSYTYFGASLFEILLMRTDNLQTYIIKFDTKFIFKYERDEQTLQNIVLRNKWVSPTFKPKQIDISLENCIEANAEELVKFVKYLFNVFNKIIQTENVRITFNNCMLDDYSFFANIEKGIRRVRFERMNFSFCQLHILSCLLRQQDVDFGDCDRITDTNVMILLKNIDFDRLRIQGTNSCTPLLCYLSAEHLMNKENVSIIAGQRFKNIAPLKFNVLKCIEFFKYDDQIVVRIIESKEIVDLYCFLNHIQEDKPLDFSTNMHTQFLTYCG